MKIIGAATSDKELLFKRTEEPGRYLTASVIILEQTDADLRASMRREHQLRRYVVLFLKEYVRGRFV